MLFKFEVRCLQCGLLMCKFTTRENALRGLKNHGDAYVKTFGETSHKHGVIKNLETGDVESTWTEKV